MNNLVAHAIAQLANLRGGRRPSLVLSRQVPAYEVDFDAVLIEEKAPLTAGDWAVLRLARDLGTVSPQAVDRWLGLGDVLSETLVSRMVTAGQLTQSQRSPGQPPRFSRSVNDNPRADPSPVCELTDEGRRSLDAGFLFVERLWPARTSFLAEPLLFLEAREESDAKHSQSKRAQKLLPEQVPESLRTLEDAVNLSPEERLPACGLAESLRANQGLLKGVAAGRRWEVRKWEHPLGQAVRPNLVLAGWASETGTSVWECIVVYRRDQATPVALSFRATLPEDMSAITRRDPGSLLPRCSGDAAAAEEKDLRPDGAWTVPLSDAKLLSLLAKPDRPEHAWLEGRLEPWSAYVLAHLVPADSASALAVFQEFLQRREPGLLQDFDGTSQAVAGDLLAYWGRRFPLPDADEVAASLWPRPDMREALCRRRFRADLEAPYESGGAA